ncbi:hypothetical protein CMV_004806 [Castanea mollissima]|uniref:Tify domain-containing protein n=1 Tax=Castanea mollissima TaxID=60419 RepID=A0A8J4VV52_9ROSI|nr:hypothetical protein CMV_004806 [Castanea mollissima]
MNGGVGGGGGVEVEARASGASGSASASTSRTSEPTITFEGEVYVFPAVTPDKLEEFQFLLFKLYWVFNFSGLLVFGHKE